MNVPLRIEDNTYKISYMPIQRAHRQLTRQDKLLWFLGDMMLIIIFFGGCFAAYALLSWITGW